MKNIEKLRANSLTLVEAKYMADKIDQLVIDLESLEGASKITHYAHNLQEARLTEAHVRSEKAAVSLRLEHCILLRRICVWESTTGVNHACLLAGMVGVR